MSLFHLLYYTIVKFVMSIFFTYFFFLLIFFIFSHYFLMFLLFQHIYLHLNITSISQNLITVYTISRKSIVTSKSYSIFLFILSSQNFLFIQNLLLYKFFQCQKSPSQNTAILSFIITTLQHPVFL